MTDAAVEIADIGSDQPDLDPSTDRYAARFQGRAGEWLLSRQTDALMALIGDDRDVTILDVGGGHGQVARPLAQAGHTVTVLATSDAALGQVKDIDSDLLKTTVGPILPLPFADTSFDIVTSFRIMAHIGDWSALLAEMTRVARRAVIFDFPIPGGFNMLEPLLFGLKKRMEGDTRRFDTMRRADVSICLEQHGFPAQRHIGQFVLPMVVHRKLKQPAISGTLEGVCRAVGLASTIGTPVVMRADRMAER
ncbi:class I SAM-dependent methyltransferase [Actibacterium sp. 188UL27-1]|uniref:class I SAM-dependent methyltransferase n=1 Tax=Actibacterium sp. 188UL27-1 TaxID=2786961 RepID=UPI00195E033E|nr:class I SAM-dependent methyltransferase [Actibacterium sp. 188UL27-1]MBM7069095.1 class I SAM-dependent methyltransferase [Actibacterium sp. 188UL27-1]